MTNEAILKDATDEKPDNLTNSKVLYINEDKETFKKKSATSGKWLSLYAAACTFCLIIAIALSLGLGLKTCDKGRVGNF